MSSTKRKRILGVGLLVLLLIGAGVYYAISQLDRVVAAIIEEQGSLATGTDVRVSGVSISVANANASISRLTIGNPMQLEGNAFELDDFAISIDPASLASDVIVLDQVDVHGARLNVLQDGVTNNLVHLQRNVSRSAGAEDTRQGEDGKRIIIRRFLFSDAIVHVSIPELDEEHELAIPDIELVDVGQAANGETAAEITRQVLTPVMENALRVAAERYLQDEVDRQLEDTAGDLVEGLRQQLEQNPRQ